MLVGAQSLMMAMLLGLPGPQSVRMLGHNADLTRGPSGFEPWQTQGEAELSAAQESLMQVGAGLQDGPLGLDLRIAGTVPPDDSPTYAAGRGTVTLQVGGNHAAFLSYAQGQRAPGASASGLRTLVHNAEGGATWTSGPLETTVGGFLTEADDLSGPTMTTGAILAAQAGLKSGLSLNASVVYTQTLQGLRHAPNWQARLDLEEQSALPTRFGPVGITSAVTLALMGPRGAFDRSVLVVEAAVNFEVGPVTLGIEGTNLLNSELQDGDFIEASDFDAGNSTSSLGPRQVGPLEAMAMQATMTLAY
jgi:hypothetical protein